MGHHDLSHHGQDPQKLAQLRMVEMEMMKALGDFMTKLKQSKEQGDSLLDRTMILFSSNLGNAANHSRKISLSSSPRRLQARPASRFNADDPPPLSNLFVTMLQRLGIESEKFGSSTGTLTGLEA